VASLRSTPPFAIIELHLASLYSSSCLTNPPMRMRMGLRAHKRGIAVVLAAPRIFAHAPLRRSVAPGVVIARKQSGWQVVGCQAATREWPQKQIDAVDQRIVRLPRHVHMLTEDVIMNVAEAAWQLRTSRE